jgi:flagellar biosynthesis protein FlhA
VPERRVEDYLRLDPLEIELGVGLLRLADPQRGGDLLAKIAALRTRAAADLGLVLPKVRIRDNIRLDDHGYRINIFNHRVATGTSLPHSVLAVDMGRATGVLDGIPDRDPATGRSSVWIDHAERAEAESMGYVVLSAVDVILTHLRTIVYRNADELLSRDATKHLIDELRQTAPTVVDELLPDVVRISDVQQVLKVLLREGVSIRPLSTILETIGDNASIRREAWFLAERARERLSRSISGALRDRNGVLYAVTLGAEMERLLLGRLETRNGQPQLELSSAEVSSLLSTLSRLLALPRQSGQPEIVVVDSRLRYALRQLTDAKWPELHVLSYTEISRDTRLESTATIETIERRDQVA